MLRPLLDAGASELFAERPLEGVLVLLVAPPIAATTSHTRDY
jgi:hypothetical protein